MEYITLQGSCLISILIPINFAVGEYSKFLKEIGLKKYYADIIVLLLGAIITGKLVRNNIDPYVSFIFMGGIIVAIVQNTLIYRKTVKRVNTINHVEKILKLIEIAVGAIIIILPHINIFYIWFLDGTNKVIHILCYFIYFFWGIEKILFCGFNLRYDEI